MNLSRIENKKIDTQGNISTVKKSCSNGNTLQINFNIIRRAAYVVLSVVE